MKKEIVFKIVLCILVFITGFMLGKTLILSFGLNDRRLWLIILEAFTFYVLGYLAHWCENKDD